MYEERKEEKQKGVESCPETVIYPLQETPTDSGLQEALLYAKVLRRPLVTNRLVDKVLSGEWR